MPNEKVNATQRELRFSRWLDAPIQLVWQVWTTPEHLQKWWGPEGFRATIHRMDFKPGGEWDLTMHSPDGTDHEIRSVFREIVKYKRIVYEQLVNFRYIATIEFEGSKDKTHIEWVMLFESSEYLIRTAREFGVDTGLTQTAEKLISYLLGFQQL
jgi:uncharacterized protein YndB with AHSA1/START domain